MVCRVLSRGLRRSFRSEVIRTPRTTVKSSKCYVLNTDVNWWLCQFTGKVMSCCLLIVEEIFLVRIAGEILKRMILYRLSMACGGVSCKSRAGTWPI